MTKSTVNTELPGTTSCILEQRVQSRVIFRVQLNTELTNLSLNPQTIFLPHAIHGSCHRDELCFAAPLPFKVNASTFHLITFTGWKRLTLGGTALSGFLIARTFPSNAAVLEGKEPSQSARRPLTEPGETGQAKTAREDTDALPFWELGPSSSKLLKQHQSSAPGANSTRQHRGMDFLFVSLGIMCMQFRQH